MSGCYIGVSGAEDGDTDAAGESGDDSSQGDGGNGDDGGSGSDDGSGSDGGGEVTYEEPLPAGLRRLTRDQIENAYRDVLLDPELALGDRLPLDPSSDDDLRFDSERVALSTYASTDVGKFDTVALSVAEEVFAKRAETLMGCAPESADDQCSSDYIEAMLSRAFRRPSTVDEVNEYISLATQTEQELGDTLKGLEFATAAALQSPWLLYLPEVGDGDGDQRPLSNYELASRLSFFLWSTPPDAELLELAAKGTLTDDDVLLEQTRRLLGDERGRQNMKRFFTQWLGYGHILELSKNSGVYPEFNLALAQGMREELDQAVFSVIDGEPYNTLFTSTQTWATPALAGFYGIEYPAGTEDTVERFEAEESARSCDTDSTPDGYYDLCNDDAELVYTVETEEATSHRVVVRAYGANPVGKGPARLRITVDSTTTDVLVEATEAAPEEYEAYVALGPGEHTIRLQLANELTDLPGERSVIIDWVDIRSSSVDPNVAASLQLPPERAGVLTRAGLLAVYAKAVDTSPTTRGMFVRQRMVCERIPSPPPGVPTELPPLNDDIKTNRERVAAHMNDPVCAGCHEYMDPLGLAMEHFDGVGKFRYDHDDTPLDVTGHLDNVAFDGALELSKLLATDPRVPRCAVTKLSRFALGVEETSRQGGFIEKLGALLETTGDWSTTVEALVLSDLFRTVGPHREEQ